MHDCHIAKLILEDKQPWRLLTQFQIEMILNRSRPVRNILKVRGKAIDSKIYWLVIALERGKMLYPIENFLFQLNKVEYLDYRLLQLP